MTIKDTQKKKKKKDTQDSSSFTLISHHVKTFHRFAPPFIPTARDLVLAFNTQTIAIASQLGSLPLDVSHQSTRIPVFLKQYFHCISPQLETFRITYGGVKSQLLCLPFTTLQGNY